MYINRITGNDVVMNDCGRVIAGIFTCAVRIGQDRSAQHIIGILVSTTHTFVDHVRQAHFCFPLHLHTHSNKHSHNASVLTDRTAAHGAHTRIDQNLRHRIFGGGILLTLISLVNSLDKINGVIIRNKLQRISNAVDQILLADYGWHNDFSYDGRDEIGLTSKKCPQFYTMTPLAAAPDGGKEREEGKRKKEKGKRKKEKGKRKKEKGKSTV